MLFLQQLVGTRKANPISTLSASVQMLRHLGLDYHANVINYAIDRTINFDKIHTPGTTFMSPASHDYVYVNQ